MLPGVTSNPSETLVKIPLVGYQLGIIIQWQVIPEYFSPSTPPLLSVSYYTLLPGLHVYPSSPFYKKQSEPFKQTNPPFSVTFLLQNPHCILYIYLGKSQKVYLIHLSVENPADFSRLLSSFFSCIQSHSIYFHFLEETCSFVAKDIYSGCFFSWAHQHSALPTIQLCHCDLLSQVYRSFLLVSAWPERIFLIYSSPRSS